MKETLRNRGRQPKNTVQEANEEDEQQSIQTNNANLEDKEENSEWDE